MDAKRSSLAIELEDPLAEVDETREEARRNTRGRFEQWAKNPKCDANVISAVHNIRMDKAVRTVASRRRRSGWLQ